jgi:hypothetical protein
MGLILHNNSWATVIEADNYLADKFGADEWSALSNTDKEKCLITAFWWIYAYPGVSILKTSTDEKVKIAQIVLAWFIYQYYVEYKKRESLISSGVKSFSLSRWSETLEKQELPQEVLALLDDALVNLGGYFPTFTRKLEN